MVGRTYQLEVSTDASHPRWSPLDEHVAAGSTVEFSASIDGSEVQIYRVTER